MIYPEEEQCDTISNLLFVHILDLMDRYPSFDVEIFLCSLMGTFIDLFDTTVDLDETVKELARRMVPFLMTPIFGPEFLSPKELAEYSEEVLNLLDQASIRELHE